MNKQNAPFVSATNNAASFFGTNSVNESGIKSHNFGNNSVQPSLLNAPRGASAATASPVLQHSPIANNRSATAVHPVTAPLRTVGSSTISNSLRPVPVSYNRAAISASTTSRPPNFPSHYGPPVSIPLESSAYLPPTAAAKTTGGGYNTTTLQPSAANFFGVAPPAASANAKASGDGTTGRVSETSVIAPEFNEGLASLPSKEKSVTTPFHSTVKQQPLAAFDFFATLEVNNSHQNQQSRLTSSDLVGSTADAMGNNNESLQTKRPSSSSTNNSLGEKATGNVNRNMLMNTSQKANENTAYFQADAQLPQKNIILGPSKLEMEEEPVTRLIAATQSHSSIDANPRTSAADIDQSSAAASNPRTVISSKPSVSKNQHDNSRSYSNETAETENKEEVSSDTFSTGVADKSLFSETLASTKSNVFSTDNKKPPVASGDNSSNISTPFTVAKKISYKLPNLPLPPPTPPPGTLRALLHAASAAVEVEHKPITNNSPCFRVPPPLDLSKVIVAPASGNSGRRKLSFTRNSSPLPSAFDTYRKNSFSSTPAEKSSTLATKSPDETSIPYIGASTAVIRKLDDSPTPSLKSYDTAVSKGISTRSAQILTPKVDDAIIPAVQGIRPASTVVSDAGMANVVAFSSPKAAEESSGYDGQSKINATRSPRASVPTSNEVSNATLNSEDSAQLELNPEAEIPPIMKDENHAEILLEGAAQAKEHLEPDDLGNQPLLKLNESRENSQPEFHYGPRLGKSTVASNSVKELPELHPRRIQIIMSNKDSFIETAVALDSQHHPLKLEPESDHPVHDIVSNEIRSGISATTTQDAAVPPPTIEVEDRTLGLHRLQEQPSSDKHIVLGDQKECESFMLKNTWDLGEDYAPKKHDEERKLTAGDNLSERLESKTHTILPPLADNFNFSAYPHKAADNGSLESSYQDIMQQFYPNGKSLSQPAYSRNDTTEDFPGTSNAFSKLLDTTIANDAEVDKPGAVVRVQEESEFSHYSSGKGAGSLHESLPLGWVEVVHPENNQLYYFNQELNISQWERPETYTGSKASVLQEEAESIPGNIDFSPNYEQVNEVPPSYIHPSIDTGLKTNVAANVIKSDFTLPPGWVELVHSEANSAYYYNSDSNVTQWEHPNHVLVLEQDSSPERELSSTYEVGVRINEGKKTSNKVELIEDNLPPEVDSVKGYDRVDDDALNLGVRINEGKMTSNKVELIEDNAPPDGDSAKRYDGVDDDALNLTQGPLPPGWVELQHSETLEYYYYNSKLNISQWDRPMMTEYVSESAYSLENVLQEATCETTDTSGEEANEADVKAVIAVAAYHKPPLKGLEDDIASQKIGPPKGSAIQPSDVPPVNIHPSSWVEIASEDGKLNISEREAPDMAVRSGLPEKHAAFETFEDVSVAHTEKNIDSVGVFSGDMFGPEFSSASAQKAIQGYVNREEVVDEKATLPLPPGWIEVKHPETQQVYYYNQEFNLSQWEFPMNSELQIESDLVVQAVNQGSTPLEKGYGLDESFDNHSVGPSDEPLNVSKEVALETFEDDAAALVEESVASIAASSVEALGSELALASALKNNQVSVPSEEVGNEVTAPKIPVGWIEVKHPETLEVYYYNQEFNLSQWEFPMNSELQEENVVAAQAVNQDSTPLEMGYVLDESIGNHSLGPNDKPTNVSKEESQEKKAVLVTCEDDAATLVEESVASIAALSVEALGSELASTSAQKSSQVSVAFKIQGEEVADKMTMPKLPAGWIEVKHPETQQVYYYNQEFNLSQWDFPMLTQEENDLVVQALNQGLTPLETDYVVGDSIEKPPDVVRDEAIEKDAAFETSKETAVAPVENIVDSVAASSDEMLGHELEWTSAHKLIQVSEKYKIQSEEFLDETTMPTLPAGWIEVKHPETQQVYYYNQEFNLSQWEFPIDNMLREENILVVQAVNQDSTALLKVDHDLDGDQSLGPDDKKIPYDSRHISCGSNMEATEIPDGWVKLKDPTTQTPYYYRESTGETCWNLPALGRHDLSNAHLDRLTDNSFTIPEELKQDASVQKKLYNVASSQVLHQRNGIRRVHAIVSFGFGGRLCIMRPEPAKRLAPITVGTKKLDSAAPISWRKGPIQVCRLCHLLDPSLFSLPNPATGEFLGPWNASTEEKAWEYLSLRCTLEEEQGKGMLWRLIMVAALSKGQLRSNEGFKNSNSPEANIVNLLVGENRSVTIESSLPRMLSSTASPSRESLARIQSLLLFGDRGTAVEEALSGNHYALALIIASMCDKKTFQDAACRFTKDVIYPGSPLHTLTALFSGALELGKAHDNSRLTPREFWGRSDDHDLISSWKHHLATIISNRTTGWEKVVRALGDELLINGNIPAAHFCYMVCGCQMSSPSPNTRLTLVGCDCLVPFNVGLMTSEAIQSYERTEAFEWAKRRGNPTAAIPALQPFKLTYAKLLADFGWEAWSTSYVDSIRLCTGLTVTSKADGVYSAEFIDDLNTFEDRVSVSLRTEPPKLLSKGSWSAVDKVSRTIKSVSSVLTKPRKTNDEQLTRGKPSISSHLQEDKRQTTMIKDGSDAKGLIDFDRSEKSLPSTSLNSSKIPSSEKKTSDVKVLLTGSQKVDMSGDSTVENKSNVRLFPSSLVNMNPAAVNIDVAAPLTLNIVDTEISEELKLSSPKSDYVTDIFVDQGEGAKLNLLSSEGLESSPSLPRKQTEQTQGMKKTMSWLGSSSSKPLDAPRSSGVQMESPPKAKNMTVRPAPKSEGAMINNNQGVSSDKSRTPWGGLRTWVSKKLNPDATEADLGGKMEAYYDKKLGRWIFPGDDPNEVSKPLAPPPVKPAVVTEEKKEDDTTKRDPLAALMAPPPSRTTANRAPLALSKRSASRATPSSLPKTDPVMTTADPPKFTVFQPVPTNQ